MSASNYAYISGKLRSLENKILSSVDIERMVDAPDHVSAFKVLNDTDYADNLLEVAPEDYRQALHEDYRQLFDFFSQVIPDKRLLTIIFLDRDFVNLKLFFKSKYFDLDASELVNKNTIYNTEDLRRYIFEETNNNLPKDIKAAIDNVKNQLDEKVSPEVIDTLLSQEYFKLLKKTAKKIRSKLIKGYVEILINNANIITFLRAKRLGLTVNELNKMLITDGAIDTKNLVSLFDQDTKELRKVVANNYDSKIIEAFDEYIEKNLLFNFEKSLEDFKTRYIRQANQIAYGPEVVMAYYISKLNAIANIRIIMTGKFNKIPSKSIKETLREIF